MRTEFPRAALSRAATASSVPAMGAALLCLGLLAAHAVPTAAQEQQQEQQEEQRQEGAHEVRKGDTLWDLAGQYLADPFSWHRIYQANQGKIEDPHWIYPGQLFVIPGLEGETGAVTDVAVRRRAPGDERAQEDDEGAEEGAEAAGRREAAGADQGRFDAPSIFDRNPEQSVTTPELSLAERQRPSLVSASDFYKAPFVAHFDRLRPRGKTERVIRENPLGLDIPPAVQVRHRVVVSLDGLSVGPGDTLQAVSKGRGLDEVGDVIHSRALLVVREVRRDSAEAVVTAVFGSYHEGDPVVSAESYTLADLRTLQPVDEGMVVRVAGVEIEQPLVSTGDLLFLDVGTEGGVRVGDEFAVFPRRVDDVRTASLDDRLGIVRVVRVRPRTATARVVNTNDVGLDAGLEARLIRRAVRSSSASASAGQGGGSGGS